MSLRYSFVKGVKWSFIQQIFTQLINYISVFWLASLITPTDFGKVALVVVFIGVFEAINGFGVSQLIIRDNITDIKIISTNFWLVFFLSAGLTIICLGVGVVYSLLFHFDNILEFNLIIAVSASSIILNGINSVFNALYSRDLDFKSTSKYFVFSFFIGNICAIIAGYMGLGYWALIVKNIFPIAVLCICYFTIGNYRILFYFNKAFIRNTWNFTSNFTYFNALNYLIRNLDYIVIGKFFDLATVGQYSIAYKIMLFPMKNITARIHTVLYPMLVKMKDDFVRLERIYTLIVSGIAYLIFPMIVIISSLANLWVPIFFDVAKYDKLIVLVQILSVVGAAQAITGPVMSLYLISGKTKILFRTGLVIAFISGMGFILGGISGNIYHFALIYSAIQLFLSVPISNYVPFRLMRFDFGDFIRKIFLPFVAAFVSYFVVVWTLPMIILSTYLKMTLLTVLGIGSYLFILLIISGTKLLDQVKQIKLMIIQK